MVAPASQIVRAKSVGLTVAVDPVAHAPLARPVTLLVSVCPIPEEAVQVIAVVLSMVVGAQRVVSTSVIVALIFVITVLTFLWRNAVVVRPIALAKSVVLTVAVDRVERVPLV